MGVCFHYSMLVALQEPLKLYPCAGFSARWIGSQDDVGARHNPFTGRVPLPLPCVIAQAYAELGYGLISGACVTGDARHLVSADCREKQRRAHSTYN